MNAVYGLIWEQWRQSRWVIGLSLLAMALLTSTSVLMESVLHGFDEEVLYGLWWIIVLAMLLIVPQHSLKAMRMSLPPRLLVLPVSPATLVTTQFLYLCGVTLLLNGLALAAISLFEPLTAEHLIPMVLMLLATAWAYAFICCFTGRELPQALLRFLVALGMTAVLLPFVNLLIIVPLIVLASEATYLPLGLDFAMLTVGALVAAWFLSFIMVRGAKRGRSYSPFTRGRKLSLPWPSWPRFRFLDSFREPRFAALVWYEWRQTLAILPAITAPGLVAILLLSHYQPPFLVLGYYLSIAVAFGVGFYAFRANEWYRGFQFVRPMSTGRMAGAKLAAAALTTLLCGGMLALFMMVLMVIHSYRIPMELEAMGAPTTWLWLTLLLALWIALLFGRVLMVAAGITYVAMIPLLMLLKNDFTQEEVAISLCAAIVVAALGIGALYVLRTRLVSLPVLWKTGALAFATFLLISFSLAWIQKSLAVMEDTTPPSMHVPVLLVVLAIGLGLVPLLYLPILLRHQRHG